MTSASNGSGKAGEEALVEGWRAVLSVVSRAGMGARRRRSDIFGPVAADQDGGEAEGADVDSLVESVKRGGVRLALLCFCSWKFP